jgi:hypothetical protein
MSTQKTEEVQPARTFAEIDPIANNPELRAALEATRQRVIASGKNLPSLAEMTTELDNINGQIAHWRDVLG